MSMLSYCVQAANLAKQHTHNSHPHAHTHSALSRMIRVNSTFYSPHNITLNSPISNPSPFYPLSPPSLFPLPFHPLSPLSLTSLSFLFSRQYFSTAREESNSHWQKTMICTIILFPVIVVLVTSALNCVAGKN